MAGEGHIRSQSRPFLPLFRASSLLPFIRFLEAAGAPADRYLAAARLSPGLVETPEGLVPLRQGLMFVDRAANGEANESIGLSVGERTEIDKLGALGRVILRSVTVGDAIGSASAHIQHYNSAQRIWLLREDDRVLVCHALDVSRADGDRHGALFTTMLLIKVIRMATGPKWWPREIRLPVCAAKWLKDYEAVVPTDWLPHTHPFFALVLDRPLLAHAMTGRSEQREAQTDEVTFLRSTAPADDLSGSVRQAIGRLLCAGYPDIRLAAEAAGLSVRTFTRRLAEEGTSYKRLVEQVRFEVAASLLRDAQIKLIDMAYELGYGDPANFTRAFKHWAGMPPSEYRRLCGMGVIPAAPTAPLPTNVHKDSGGP
jgi:AraC-like DNA-binding protein